MPKKRVASNSKIKKVKNIVPDTSVIIEHVISNEISKGNLNPSKIIIHEAVVSELESQANKGREVGISGLEEIRKLQEISKKKFDIEFKGARPGEFHIKYAKSGEIDSMIRELAGEEGATLFTADRVQAFVAESKNIDVIFYEMEEKEQALSLEKFFDKKTMSVHLRENCRPKAKKGKPGDWEYIEIDKKKYEREELQEIGKEIVEAAHTNREGFVEIDRKGSSIIQLGRYRIVITRPPFSDGYEITAVRPVTKLKLDDYKMSSKLQERLLDHAEGILISGSPGHGKTTFAQALAEFYVKRNKVVKTVEAPRDLDLPEEVTQYAMSHGSNNEIHDILLLSRPDHTIFDEMRNTSDFKLYSDLRLSGVGMIGVVHATQTIDAVQRFIGRIELGVIPHVIDTVIFIKDGKIEKVYSLSMEVKVPSGMTESDLARPIVIVNDFDTGKLEFEIYSYGEETIVIPVQEGKGSAVLDLAANAIMDEFSNYSDVVDVEMQSSNRAVVYVMPGQKRRLIGKGGSRIEKIEEKLGVRLDIRESDEKVMSGNSLPYNADLSKRNITFDVGTKHKNKTVDIFVNGDFLLAATVSKKGHIKVTRKNKLGKIMVDALTQNEDVELRTS